MFLKKYGDLIVSLFFSALGVVLIKGAKLLPKSKVMKIGPGFIPEVIGYLTVILAVILLVMSIVALKKGKYDKSAPASCDYARVIMSVILMGLYVYFLQPIGFLISTLVFLFFQMLVLAPDGKRGVKSVISLAIIDIIFTLVVFMLFRYAFKIVLPAGIFTINL